MLIIILLILIFLFVLLFTLLAVSRLNVEIGLNMLKPEADLKTSWLGNVLKAFVKVDAEERSINLELFDRNVYKSQKRNVKEKEIEDKEQRQRKRRFSAYLKRKIKEIFREKGLAGSFELIKPEQMDVEMAYGFGQPYITGLVFGATAAVSGLSGIEKFQNRADFFSDYDYLFLNASARVNMGKVILRLAGFTK